MRSALPGVVIDAPDEERGRRDRVVDATIYLLAFVIGAAGFVDAWEQHPPWLRVPAIVLGIATLIALRRHRHRHDRARHPACLRRDPRGDVKRRDPGAGAGSGGHRRPRDRVGLRQPADLPAARRRPWGRQLLGRRRGKPVDGARRPRLGALRARAARARALAARAGRPRRGRGARRRAAADRARDARPARPSPLAALRPRRGARVSPRRSGRRDRAGGRRDPRERALGARRAARRDRRPARGRQREPDATAAADARRPRRARRRVARRRDAGHGVDRAGRRDARRRRPHRLPDRAGGSDERAQARAGRRRDAHRPRARRATCRSRSAASRPWLSARHRRCPGRGPA